MRADERQRQLCRDRQSEARTVRCSKRHQQSARRSSETSRLLVACELLLVLAQLSSSVLHHLVPDAQRSADLHPTLLHSAQPVGRLPCSLLPAQHLSFPNPRLADPHHSDHHQKLALHNRDAHRKLDHHLCPAHLACYYDARTEAAVSSKLSSLAADLPQQLLTVERQQPAGGDLQHDRRLHGQEEQLRFPDQPRAHREAAAACRSQLPLHAARSNQVRLQEQSRGGETRGRLG